jgi:signal peptide peptidase SppA
MENKFFLNSSLNDSSCDSSNAKSICYFKRLINKIYLKFNGEVIAAVNLSGVIGKESKVSHGINANNCYPLLKQAFNIRNVKAVALNINSPGGSPVQSELIYNQIRQLSESKKIPVYTFAQDLAASGGYWLLCAGDEMYAHNASIIGSIGVIFSSFGFVELIKKAGVTRRVYTEGKNKAIIDPFLEEDEENIKILKDVQRDIFEGFKDLVRARRSGKLKADEEQLFTGSFWSGKKALELGLIDGIADMRAKMTEKFGDKAEIIFVTTKKGLLKNLFSEKISMAISDFVEILLNKFEEKIQFNKFGK